MNNALFTSLITSLIALDDTQGAQLLAIVNGFASVGTQAPVQAPAPAPVQRTYEPATDVIIPIKPVKGAGRGRKAFTLGYGAGRAGAKAYVKSVGFVWDNDLKAYVGTSKAYESLAFESENNLLVTANWVQAGRDQAQAKAERKARKQGA